MKNLLKFEWLLARRYIFSKKREGVVSVIAWFSLIGIALGVGTLIVVMSVMNGFRHELFSSLVNMRGHVSIHQMGQSMIQNEDLLKTLKEIPGVRLAYPLLEHQAVLMASQRVQGVVIQGLQPDALINRPMIHIGDPQNPLPFSKDILKERFQKGSGIFIGRRLAENLNLKVGDTVSLLSPKSTATAFGSLPRQKSFKIQGLFHVGMRDFDKNFIFMPLEDAQLFFQQDHRWSQIDLFSKNDDLSTSLTNLVQQILKLSFSKENLRAFDWRHSDASIFHAVKMERNVMFLILMLIIIIASFNIITGLTMLVRDKTKDIAILRTFGGTKQSILRIFFMTGSFIGTTGTLLGLGLGLSFAINIERIRQFLQNLSGSELFSEEVYFLSTLPSKTDYHEVLMITFFSLAISFLSTLYPAYKASKINPVLGLKGDI